LRCSRRDGSPGVLGARPDFSPLTSRLVVPYPAVNLRSIRVDDPPEAVRLARARAFMGAIACAYLPWAREVPFQSVHSV
jgi:hypothetical protein